MGNIPSYKIRKGQSTDAKMKTKKKKKKKKSNTLYLSEFGDEVRYNFSIDHSRSAGLPRKSVDESQQNLHAQHCKKSYRTKNMEYFIHLNRGWHRRRAEGCVGAQSCFNECIERCQ